jgi:hypothetical protein
VNSVASFSVYAINGEKQELAGSDSDSGWWGEFPILDADLFFKRALISAEPGTRSPCWG